MAVDTKVIASFRSLAFKLRVKCPRIPAEIADRRHVVKYHVFGHPDAHGDICIWKKWFCQRKSQAPEKPRYGYDPAWLAKCVKNTTRHLSIADRLTSTQRIDFANGRLACGRSNGADCQVFRMHGLPQPQSAPHQWQNPEFLNEPREPRHVGVATLCIDQGRA